MRKRKVSHTSLRDDFVYDSPIGMSTFKNSEDPNLVLTLPVKDMAYSRYDVTDMAYSRYEVKGRSDADRLTSYLSKSNGRESN